jgi:hypothetical protein
MTALQVAFWAMTAPSFEQAVVARNPGGDADTNAAITGALAGRFGAPQVPAPLEPLRPGTIQLAWLLGEAQQGILGPMPHAPDRNPPSSCTSPRPFWRRRAGRRLRQDRRGPGAVDAMRHMLAKSNGRRRGDRRGREGRGADAVQRQRIGGTGVGWTSRSIP